MIISEMNETKKWTLKAYDPKLAFEMKQKKSKTETDQKSNKNPGNLYRALSTNKNSGM